MALTITHAKVSTIPDDPLADIKTSDWNAPLVVAGGVPADVGLSAVENTALSTWPGSTALITAGDLRTTRLDVRGVRIQRPARSWTPHTITLIGGQDDEAPGATACTIVADPVNYKVGDRGWQMQIASATTAWLFLDPPGTDDPLVFSTASAIGLWVYLEDVTKITSVTVALFSDAGLAVSGATSWTPATGLVTGWNYLRRAAVSLTLTGWGTCYRVRILVVTTAATNATIGHVWLEQQPKAQMIFIADGPYDTFYTLGYPALAALDIPVTFACAPALFGTGTGADLRMSAAQIAAAAGVNRNSIGIHSYDGTATASMTAAQIRADFMKALKWIQRRGYSRPLWRAAWVQNSATNASAIQNLVMAYATALGASGSAGAWPPVNKWDIQRYGLHGTNGADAALDTLFTSLQTTRGCLACYTHGIDARGVNDMVPAQWAYFLGKVTAAIAAGWLEGTTFEELVANTNVGVPAQHTFAPWLGAAPW